MIPADARSGSTLGKYRLHEIVGRGGMGVVYRAEHIYIGREVALKILHEGYGGREESVKRFLREARAASLINHPNIVEVTDFGKGNDGTVFFVMELLVGEPLDAILARETRLDLMRSITICNQLAAALAAAHSKGIIHRDLKPENVMLIPREGRRELVRRVSDEGGEHELSEREKQFDFVKILDFGVAKVREPDSQKGRVTQAGVVFGTPEYMAPETARIGFSDARSDIYALGIMFYEMMTGTVPFTGDAPVDVMMKQVNSRVPRMHDITPDAEITEEAEFMILKALAKDPDQRQQSMEEFHRDLQKCYGQLRFRRTVRTPAVTTPAVTTIPLTKKKVRPSLPSLPDAAGVIPRLTTGDFIAVEIDAAISSRPRMVTPRLPGLPANAGTPILLTKKKVRPSLEGAPLNGASAESSGETPAVVKKKRTTLPMVVGKGSDRTPSVRTAVAGSAPVTGPTRITGSAPVATTPSPTTSPVLSPAPANGAAAPANGSSPAKATVTESSPPRPPAIPDRLAAIRKAAMAAPARPQNDGSKPGETPTPRVTVNPGKFNDRSWLDAPAAAVLKVKRS